jgi:phage FluMu protein Com
MEEKLTMICSKCRKALVMKTVSFEYLEHHFRAEVPRCPECGQVYIPEDFVQNRMKAVEEELEDK